MTAITYTEAMSGYVSFGEQAFNTAWLEGREQRNRLGLRLEVTIDDVDRFIAHARHEARCRGWVRCERLGGRLEVESGAFNLLVRTGGERRHRRMLYRLRLRDGEGRPLTLTGFKDVRDDAFYDVWADTSVLFVRVWAGHHGTGAEPPDSLVATGFLRVGRLGFLRMLASMRARDAAPWRLPVAFARYARFFAGALLEVYRGREPAGGQPDFPAEDPASVPFQGFAPGEWHELPRREGLRRRILAVDTGDGRRITLHHIRGEAAPTRGPVLVAMGTGTRANLFYDAPVETTLVDALVAAGYDVWLENWRGSIDLEPTEWTLDEVAVFDHPAAVARVLQETGQATLKAVVHCQGATSLVMAAFAGLLPEVTHIVGTAVTLHVDVPRLSRLRMRFLVPLLSPGFRFLDPQWVARAPALRASALARWASLVRRECRDPVCAMANYTYGVGGDVLWRHGNLEPATHRWLAREFGWVPTSFFRQMARCAGRGHLVRVRDDLPALPADLAAQPPLTDASVALLAGSRNRCFLPSGQRRTLAWLREHAPGASTLDVVEGYSHLDLLIGRGTAERVFPKVLAGLDLPPAGTSGGRPR